MRIPPARARLLLAAFALAAGACREATAPADTALSALAGTFVLQSVDGVPLPVPQGGYLPTAPQYLAADTLTADGRGGYTRVQVFRTDSVGRGVSVLQRATIAGTYAIQRDTISFPVQCPPGALCIRTPVGWRRPNGDLVLAYPTTSGFQFVSDFARVR